jgi:hypothetical protein
MQTVTPLKSQKREVLETKYILATTIPVHEQQAVYDL